MEPRTSARSRILLVEDDVRTARTLARLLREDGYVVEVEYDSEDAIARLDRAPIPDVLIVDFLLPHADGLAVASHGRARSAALPVLVVTSYSEVLARLDRRLDPPAVVLSKPLAYGDLTRALDGLRTAAAAT